MKSRKRQRFRTNTPVDPLVQNSQCICVFSKHVRFTAKIICIIAPMVGIAYAFLTLEERVWYMIALYGIVGEIAALGFMGSLIFLLKPIFFFVRMCFIRKIIKKEVQRSETERKLLDLSQPYDTELHQRKIEDLIQNYMSNIEQLLKSRIELQRLQAKREKFAEWKWVVAGLIALTLVVLTMIAFALAAVFLVIIMVVCAFLSVHPPSDRPYNDRYYGSDEKNEEELLLFRLFNYLSKKEQEAEEQKRYVIQEIRRCESNNNLILKKLHSYRASELSEEKNKNIY